MTTRTVPLRWWRMAPGVWRARIGRAAFPKLLSASGAEPRSEALVAEFAERGFPLSVIGLEPGWHTTAYPSSFQWHPQRFPDPDAFAARLRQRGVRLNLWEHPYVAPQCALATIPILARDGGIVLLMPPRRRRRNPVSRSTSRSGTTGMQRATSSCMMMTE